MLFTTYTTLVAGSRSRTRMQQIVEWCGGAGFDGCLVFDECHKAKNYTPAKGGGEPQGSKVAAMVIQLQQALPNARVVYCSATGVSEIGSSRANVHPCSMRV